MNSSFFRSFSFSFGSFFLFAILICIFFIPIYANYPEAFGIDNTTSDSFIFSSSEYVWPIPGYTKITSPFGKRETPTEGATSYHKGIDIGAPEGTSLYAMASGEITFADFLGGGGYTITLSTDKFKITYCHVSPNFLVRVGDMVQKGQLIAHVGPMYVDNVPNNPYHDSNGKPTNGAMTGCHLHLGIRKEESYLDPLGFFR